MNDSWDEFENRGFFRNLRFRWRAWREHRKMIAEERREIRRIETEGKALREVQDPEIGVSSTAVREIRPAKDKDSRQPSESQIVTRLPESREESDRRPGKGGLMEQWRLSAEMRHQIRKERKAISSDLHSEVAPDASEDDFAVGGKRHGSDTPDTADRVTTGMLLGGLWDELLRLKIPQWLVAMTPSIAMLVSVIIPAATDVETRAAEHVSQLAGMWPGKIAAGAWKEAEICGTRVLQSGVFGIEDDFRYFDCLRNTRDLNHAVFFLRSQETRVPVSDLAKFRYRLAERLAQLPNAATMPALQNFVLTKLRESLNGPLTLDQEIKARQILASSVIVQGDFAGAVRYLEPIANQSPSVAADLLFIRYNQASDQELAQITATAAELLVNLETRNQAQVWSDVRNIESKLRLLMILDRASEASQWLNSLKNLDAETRQAMVTELNKHSLISEARKRPVRAEVIWTRLQPLIEQEPNNPTWARLALQIWVNGEAAPGSPVDRWVRARLDSDSADPVFLREGSMIAHLGGRWPEARAFYARLIEKEPRDASALNNLAGLMYKFPPRDLNESLRLVDRALEVAPTNLIILETRGQILARMGRLDEARQILEKALPVLPREWNLHNTIAQLYDRLGETKNAAAHRSILETIPKPKDSDDYANLSDFLNDRPKRAAENAPVEKKASEKERPRQPEPRKSRS